MKKALVIVGILIAIVAFAQLWELGNFNIDSSYNVNTSGRVYATNGATLTAGDASTAPLTIRAFTGGISNLIEIINTNASPGPVFWVDTNWMVNASNLTAYSAILTLGADITPGTHNTYDIGSSGTRMAEGYFASLITTNLSMQATSSLNRVGDVLRFSDVSGTLGRYSSIPTYSRLSFEPFVEDWWSSTATAGQLGFHNWQSSIVTPSGVAANGAPGCMRFANAAAASTYGYAYIGTSTVNASGRLDDRTWSYSWRMRLNDGTNCVVRFGWETEVNVYPQDAICWAITNGTGYSTWIALTRSSHTESIKDTGVTADGSFHWFTITCDGLASITYYIDGTSYATNTSNVPTAGMRQGITIYNTDGVSRSLDVDTIQFIPDTR